MGALDHAVEAICALFEFDDDCEGAVEACEPFLSRLGACHEAEQA
ncbi:hypothetical protein ACIQU4_42220 [Streptomyces sp. NPDC090741]